MLHRSNPCFVPHGGRALKTVSVSRISTDHKDERSLEDQLAKHKSFMAGQYFGPIEWKVIKSRGSGEHLDRNELNELEQLIESDEFDLVIAEDLGRICRSRRAYDLCELCVDHKVRLIAINDRVDTGEDGWEDGAFISTWHHERSNRDTSERIKRSLRNRFQQGGVCQTFPYATSSLRMPRAMRRSARTPRLSQSTTNGLHAWRGVTRTPRSPTGLMARTSRPVRGAKEKSGMDRSSVTSPTIQF